MLLDSQLCMASAVCKVQIHVPKRSKLTFDSLLVSRWGSQPTHGTYIQCVSICTVCHVLSLPCMAPSTAFACTVTKWHQQNAIAVLESRLANWTTVDLYVLMTRDDSASASVFWLSTNILFLLQAPPCCETIKSTTKPLKMRRLLVCTACPTDHHWQA
jgi:hypothetical protein